MAALFVYEGLVLAQTLLILKKVPWSRQTFGRLSGLGTSGWRGALSAVKSSVQKHRQKMLIWLLFIDKVAKGRLFSSFIGATHWTSNERQAESAASPLSTKVWMSFCETHPRELDQEYLNINQISKLLTKFRP
jgi:hypothetical protein